MDGSCVFCRAGRCARDLVAYGAQRAVGHRPLSVKSAKSIEPDQQAEINKVLTGYPRNHNYAIRKDRLEPSVRLYRRARVVTGLYADPVGAFLDIGSCRGYYVLQAAANPACTAATGIDVVAPFIEVSSRVGELMGSKAQFRVATVADVAADPAAFGGPFQTVLLIGTYHYLYWGSGLSDICYGSHEAILDRLAEICTGRLLVSGRLDPDRLPSDIRPKMADATDLQRREYCTAGFLQAAQKHFEPHLAGHLGTYALYVLTRKNA